MNEISVRYQTDTGTELTLTPADIRRTICAAADDKEIELFLRLCQAQKLNPFLREAYLIKYGNSPASMVIGKDVATKRAAKHADCAGYNSGVIIQRGDGEPINRDGTLILKGENLVGGWAKVWRKSWSQPYIRTVSLGEYAKPSNGNNWAKMPGTMIAKVALVQALRDVFPEDLQGLYDADEITNGGSAELEARPSTIETVSPPETIVSAPTQAEIIHPQLDTPTIEDIGKLTKFIKDMGITRPQYLADMNAHFPQLMMMKDGKPEKVLWVKCDMATYQRILSHFNFAGTDFNDAPVTPDFNDAPILPPENKF